MIDFSDAPSTKPRFEFSTDKWDDHYARNALLYFISEKGLDDEFLAWLNRHGPMTEDEQEKIREFARFIAKGMDGDAGLDEPAWLAIAENFIKGQAFQQEL